MIDKLDREILSILQINSRTSNAEIGRKVELTTSGVFERIKRMKERGVIQKFELRIEPKSVGLNVLGFVSVALHEMKYSRATAKELLDIQEIQEIYHIVGEDCLLLKVRCTDTPALGYLLERINAIKWVRGTRTTMALNPHKETLSLPLNIEE